MTIDPKKYTRAELAKMVEDAQKSNGALEVQISGLCAQIDKKNDALSEYANEKEALKADADLLRTELADTEAALGRANASIAELRGQKGKLTEEISGWRSTVKGLQAELHEWVHMCESASKRAKYAETHPWRNLWEWIKRKLWWA